MDKRYSNEQIHLIRSIFPVGKDSTVDEICSHIESIYNKFNDNLVYYTDNYKSLMVEAFNSLNVQKFFRRGGSGIDLLNSQYNEQDVINEVANYDKRLEALRYLEFLSEEKSTVVMVGPNGCGKTTLIRYLLKSFGEQKIGFYPADRLLVISDNYNPQRDFKAFVKTYKESDRVAADLDSANQNIYISRQINEVISLFEKVHAQEMDLLHDRSLQEDDSKTLKILHIWNNLVKDRLLFSKGDLRVKTLDGNEYPIRYLSSGEKSILYFLVSIILKERKDYYFIDEPENNLNPAIVSSLWNVIENEMSDSVFVYLTHDSHFVDSRVNSKLFWIESFDGKNWKYQKLPQNDALPQELMISLVGNRMPVLFCESHDEYKYDLLVYKMMFSEFKVVPAGGCGPVIRKVSAFKHVGFPQRAFGIIDSDYKDLDYLEGLAKNDIYYLPFFEIENMLICKEIVTGVIKQYSSQPESAFLELQEAVKNDFKNNKEQWLLRKTAYELEKKFFNDRINSLKNLDELKNKYREYQGKIKIDAIYTKYLEQYEKIVKTDDYNHYLRFYDSKGMFKKFVHTLHLSNRMPYEKVVFEYLKYHPEVLKAMRRKYFPNIKE